jgi:hypothetical protein
MNTTEHVVFMFVLSFLFDRRSVHPCHYPPSSPALVDANANGNASHRHCTRRRVTVTLVVPVALAVTVTFPSPSCRHCPGRHVPVALTVTVTFALRARHPYHRIPVVIAPAVMSGPPPTFCPARASPHLVASSCRRCPNISD